MEIRFNVSYTSTPIRPSTNNMKVVQCQLCLRQAPRYFILFALSAVSRQYRGIWTGRRWHQYSRHACREYCPSPASKGLLWGDPPSALLRSLKGILWACTYLYARRNLCRFWGHHARAWERRPCLQGQQPHHGARCDASWWGLPSWSQGCGRWKMPRHIHINVQVSQWSLYNI